MFEDAACYGIPILVNDHDLQQTIQDYNSREVQVTYIKLKHSKLIYINIYIWLCFKKTWEQNPLMWIFGSFY